MTTENHVSFEIAKLLKENGFNEPCKMWYAEYTSAWGGDPSGDRKYINIQFDDRNRFNESYKFLCYAPNVQRVKKWLREKYNIHIEIRITNHSISNMVNIAKYYWVMVNTETVKWYDESTCYNVKGFDTPEEAEEDAIIHLLEKMR